MENTERPLAVIKIDLKEHRRRLAACIDPDTSKEIEKKIMDLKIEEQDAKLRIKSQIKKIENEAKSEVEKTAAVQCEILSNSTKWIEDYVMRKGFKFEYSNYLKNFAIKTDGNSIDLETFANKAHQDYTNELRSFNNANKTKATKMQERDFDSAIVQWVRSERTKREQELLDTIKYDGRDHSSLRKWLELTVENPTPADFAVVMHSLIQVKRKMLRLPVKYHLVNILVGAQRAGKDWALDVLFTPFKGFSKMYGVDQIVDPSLIEDYSKYFIINLVELAGADRASIATLKGRITSPTIDGRTPYARYSSSFPNLVTFFGTANKDVQEFIKDDTGMLRFWQLNALRRTDEQRKEMDAIDPVAIWKSVDETMDDWFYKDQEEEIVKKQAELTTDNPIDLWADEMELIPTTNGKTKLITADAAYNSMKEYFEHSGYKGHPVKNNLGKILKRMGIIKKDKQYNGLRYSVYTVNFQCLIPCNIGPLLHEFEPAKKVTTLLDEHQ